MTQEIKKWLFSNLEDADFQLEEIGILDSPSWSLISGALEHESGLFFRVVGSKWKDVNGKIIEQPLLKQEEIGTLGFLIEQKDDGNEILVQAKIEPGNVDTIQLSPTCQATESNAKRIHGGEMPPFVECFKPLQENIVYDLLHSEQGTRFLNKRNRNVLVLNKGQKIPELKSHRWIKIDQMLGLLDKDFMVNTDARSVLVSSPWDLLIGRDPFSLNREGFGRDLRSSYTAEADIISLQKLEEEIASFRSKVARPEIIDLEKLKGWNLKKELSRENSPFKVKQIKVLVKSREVPEWDQPIIDSFSEGEVILQCAKKNGTLYFLFKMNAEPGLYHKAELTPTFVREPGVAEDNKTFLQKGRLIASCKQSEEGGRFFRDVNNFKLEELTDFYNPPDGYYWLNLRQIREILDKKCWFTNEARSVLSLTLPWL